jgi:hypothetical protein
VLVRHGALRVLPGGGDKGVEGAASGSGGGAGGSHALGVAQGGGCELRVVPTLAGGFQVYLRTYVYTYIHTYIRVYIHTYMHTYIHTYIHDALGGRLTACIYVRIHVCMHVCIYVCMYVCGRQPLALVLTSVAAAGGGGGGGRGGLRKGGGGESRSEGGALRLPVQVVAQLPGQPLKKVVGVGGGGGEEGEVVAVAKSGEVLVVFQGHESEGLHGQVCVCECVCVCVCVCVEARATCRAYVLSFPFSGTNTRRSRGGCRRYGWWSGPRGWRAAGGEEEVGVRRAVECSMDK